MEINIKSNYNFNIVDNDDELIVKIKKNNIDSFTIKNDENNKNNENAENDENDSTEKKNEIEEKDDNILINTNYSYDDIIKSKCNYDLNKTNIIIKKYEDIDPNINYYDLLIYVNNENSEIFNNINFVDIYKNSNNLLNYNKIREKVNDVYYTKLNNSYKKEDNVLFELINKHYKNYSSTMKDIIKHNILNKQLFFDNIKDNGYLINKFEKNKSYFGWHNDGYKNCDNHEYLELKKKDVPDLKLLQVIICLSDINHKINFLSKNIEIKKGTILIFPCNFMFPYKINSYTEDFYLCTSYFYI